MNASMVRSLIRMGLAVGAHLEHPVSLGQIDGMSNDLAQPVVDALASDEVQDPTLAVDGRPMCWHGWTAEVAASGVGCHGGCRCILDRDLLHGAGLNATDIQVPHVCRRGHAYRFPV